MGWSQRLGRIGVWRGVNDVGPQLARIIEGLGYGTIWQGGSPDSPLRQAEELLDATQSIQIATGVVNIWKSDAAELADSYHRIEATHPGRLLLGVGSVHREATPERVRPIQAMAGYLDVLDARGVPVEARVLSALGPRMLGLAARRSAGTHPYLSVPSQTREARAILGSDALVAPEQTVVLDADLESGCRTARTFLRRYLGMINYTSTMRRGGFSDAGHCRRRQRRPGGPDCGPRRCRRARRRCTSSPRCWCRSCLRSSATSRGGHRACAPGDRDRARPDSLT